MSETAAAIAAGRATGRATATVNMNQSRSRSRSSRSFSSNLTSNSSSSWFWTSGGLVMMIALLGGTKQWHATSTSQYSSLLPSRDYVLFSNQRILQGNNNNNNDITDDVTRDEVCRKYIWSFLNGTTDIHDECEGFYNAFKAADCKDDKQVPPLINYYAALDIDNKTTNDDNTPPSPSNDDFDNWECCQSISEYYNKNCQKNGLDSVRLLGIVSVLVICGLMRTMIRTFRVMQWVPNAGVCILVGAVTGGILRLVSTDVVQDKLAFDNDLFLQILLPPIIFESAISIDKQAFRRDLFPILAFAVFGTGLSALAIGFITFRMSALLGPALPLLDSLLFGALMSSIDPVATLSILSSVGVRQTDTLYTLIFGESLLNDGVAIVLFDSLVRHMGDKDVVDVATVHDTLFNFLWVTTGSMGVGIVCGGFSTLYFWTLNGKQKPVAEVGLFFAWALIPYYIAEGFHLSGIIAIMVMGLMMDYFVIGGFQSDEGEWMEYMAVRHHTDTNLAVPPVQPQFERVRGALAKAFSGRGHIHVETRKHVGFCAEVISSVMETAIFAYLGLFLFNEKDGHFLLMGTGIVACASSRAGMVIILSLLVNICVWMDLEGFLGRLWRVIFCPQQTREPIRLDDDSVYDDTDRYLDRRTQLILFSAGVRGAVSYSLVQNIPVYNSVTKYGSHFKGELKAMTSATIVVLLFAFGAITYYTVRRDWMTSSASSSPEQARGGGGGGGYLTHRLLSMSLTSDDGNILEDEGLGDDRDRLVSSLENSLEIDGGPLRSPHQHQPATNRATQR